jgi:hypothetical protein
MMKTLLTAAALVVAITTSAVAETYNYACKIDSNGNTHLYAAKIDTKARTLTWRGSVFQNLKASGGDDCAAKYCFEATRRDLTVTVNTATQGAATLQVVGTKPGDDGILEDVECDLVRNK